MSEIKKYLFDNFVVEDDKKKEPEEVDVEVVEEPDPEPEEVKQEEVPVITYTEEEVEEKLQQTKTEAYQKGVISAQEGIEAVNANLLNDINNKLENLFKDNCALRTELEKQFAEMGKLLIQKVIPPLEDEYAEKIISDFIKDNFNNIKDESKLSFFLNPEAIAYAQDVIGKLASAADFEGKISLHKDDSLAKSDVRIEWENGGVECNSKNLINKVTSLLDDKQE